MKLFNKNITSKIAWLTLLVVFNGQLHAVEKAAQEDVSHTRQKNELLNNEPQKNEQKNNKQQISETIAVEQTEAKQALMAKLANISHFKANFTQSIFDEEGDILQQGQGELAVSKPNLVYWHTKTPDESIIVADGNDLWFYDPFVEQVSVYDFADAIANTPILLISNNDQSLWNNYTVIQVSDNHYKIKAQLEASRIERLEIIFKDKNSVLISELILLDNTGQLSKFILADHQSTIDGALFQFVVPEGVHIDDQR